VGGRLVLVPRGRDYGVSLNDWASRPVNLRRRVSVGGPCTWDWPFCGLGALGLIQDSFGCRFGEKWCNWGSWIRVVAVGPCSDDF